jgi:hypothetical protein
MQLFHAPRPTPFGPTTPTGRMAGWFALGFGVALALAFVRVLVADDPDSTRGSAWMVATGFGALLCGIAAGVSGLVAIVRKGERSLVCYLALVPGLLALVFLLAEIVFPHE